MAKTSSDESLVSSTTQSNTMAARQTCDLHNSKTPITKPTRFVGFLKEIEVEAVPAPRNKEMYVCMYEGRK